MKYTTEKRLMLCICCLTMLLSAVWTSHAKAHADYYMTTEDVSAIIDNYLNVCQGRYWNKDVDSTTMHRNYLSPANWVECTSDHACLIQSGKSHLRKNGCTSNAYGGLLTYASSGQCQAFVSYLVDVIFGENAGGYYQKVSGRVGDNFTVKPGDVIRYKTNHGSQHAVMVYRVNGDSFSIVQCNVGGKCLISSGTNFASTKKASYNSCTMSSVRSMLNDSNATVWQSPATQNTVECQQIAEPVSLPVIREPEIYPLGQNMTVAVGAGSTLRFCSTVSVADAYEIGSIPDNAVVYVYGITTQSYEDRVWAKIQYNGNDGWVNSKWLADCALVTPEPVIREYTISYVANGGAGSMPEQEMVCGTASPLRLNSFYKEGYVFSGWSGSPSGPTMYSDGQSVDLSSIGGICIALYAQWEPSLTLPVHPETQFSAPDSPAPDPVPVLQTPPSISVSDSNIMIDRAIGDTSYVSVHADGDLPLSWYCNLAAAGPFICEWISSDTFAIHATNLGSAELEVLLCDGATDQVLAKDVVQVSVVDNTSITEYDYAAFDPASAQSSVRPPSISVSDSNIKIDRAIEDTACVSVSADGDLPVNWYWNLAAAGPFVCEWVSGDTFAIHATDIGSADLEVLLCDGATNQVLATSTLVVSIVDNTPSSQTAEMPATVPAVVYEDTMPSLSISGQNMPSILSPGQNFGIRGTICTDCGLITVVYGCITDIWGNTVMSGTYYPYEMNHNLQYSINNDLVFGRLSPGDYKYSVVATAVNGNQETTQTLIESYFVIEAAGPSAVMGLKAEYYDANKAFVSWDAVPNAAYYEVQYFSRGQNAWTSDGSYVSGTAYVSTGLDKYDSWQYRVRSVNSNGYSEWAEITYYKI